MAVTLLYSPPHAAVTFLVAPSREVTSDGLSCLPGMPLSMLAEPCAPSCRCQRLSGPVNITLILQPCRFFNPDRPKASQMSNPNFTAPAINGYERALCSPPRMVQDISYHLNAVAIEKSNELRRPVVTINTAVEESTVADRNDELLHQDAFIRDNLAVGDAIVVSMGGNDVALRPSISTIFSMLFLTNSPLSLIKCGSAPGQAHLEHLFGERVRHVAERIVKKTKPAVVVICMLYYLDERPGGSWADPVLSKLGYDKNPAKLQQIIFTLCERLTRRGLNIDGTRVEICPLFEALDGSDTSDYCQRVEPSVTGGRKIADRIWKTLYESGAFVSVQ
eukprot:scaffold142472_cov35-Tisochrysis_lutea.AAC.1